MYGENYSPCSPNSLFIAIEKSINRQIFKSLISSLGISDYPFVLPQKQLHKKINVLRFS